jgi:hypothetical protein
LKTLGFKYKYRFPCQHLDTLVAASRHNASLKHPVYTSARLDVEALDPPTLGSIRGKYARVFCGLWQRTNTVAGAIPIWSMIDEGDESFFCPGGKSDKLVV